MPVGRKCSVCNGPAPKLLYELKHISRAYYPLFSIYLFLYFSTAVSHQTPLKEASHVDNRCMRIPRGGIRCFWWFSHVIMWKILQMKTFRRFRMWWKIKKLALVNESEIWRQNVRRYRSSIIEKYFNHWHEHKMAMVIESTKHTYAESSAHCSK